MAFVDELTITAKAGDGGKGVVRWLHLKSLEFGGPSGGNGGDGGDVYLRAVRDINLLSRYRSANEFNAGDGAPGEGRGKDGKSGSDLHIDVPRGSIVTNESTGETYELLREGETVLVLKGGRGGAGNKVFKSSVNRSPEQAYPGAEGEAARFRIELRLIADAGLVGLPNAGKTTLLNALTGASAKVGSYAFTTLEPNLGMLYEFVLADIPGLIEGASQGKGLGSKFLRHVSRTGILMHCVSLESDDIAADYRTVRGELAEWGGGLESKPEIVILTKSDSRDSQKIEELRRDFIAAARVPEKKVFTVSVLDDASLSALSKTLVEILRGHSKVQPQNSEVGP